MSIEQRISKLENQHPDQPIIPVYQDIDDPDLFHPGGRDAEPITWEQVEADFSDYLVLVVRYKKGIDDRDS